MDRESGSSKLRESTWDDTNERLETVDVNIPLLVIGTKQVNTENASYYRLYIQLLFNNKPSSTRIWLSTTAPAFQSTTESDPSLLKSTRLRRFTSTATTRGLSLRARVPPTSCPGSLTRSLKSSSTDETRAGARDTWRGEGQSDHVQDIKCNRSPEVGL